MGTLKEKGKIVQSACHLVCTSYALHNTLIYMYFRVSVFFYGFSMKLLCAFTNGDTLVQWHSEGWAWPGTCSAKVRPAHVCATTSVVSAMVKRTVGPRSIPITWLLHCIGSPSLVWLGTSPGGSDSIILLTFLHLVCSFLYLVDNLVTVHSLWSQVSS